MKKLLFIPIILCCFMVTSCDELFEDEPSEYEGPITIRNLEAIDVDQFHYTIQWEVLDGNGEIIDPNDVTFQYEENYGFQGSSSGRGQGNTYTPDINRKEQGERINVIQICGSEIKVKITASVQGADDQMLENFAEISVFPPVCDYELYSVGEQSGSNSSVCDFGSQFTYRVKNLTYGSYFEDEFGFDQLFDDNTGYNGSKSFKIEIAEVSILDATNSVVDVQPLYRMADLSPSNGFQILGPQVSKVNCQQPALISFKIDFNLLDNQQSVIVGETINKQFDF
ncbi:hypothetical protein JKA74_09190 [Marivirga sp. S37H4]|uniref:Uncharacterized protein n=1 Tax=Marivirga aurantiaca TaxID=2802615 RepID=A0A935C8W3_9BACT|nr:hypothetical protein [Marivirga aurantiaca]MBK6265212.1 hypothetical protein [Marivirga aurantiaca]